MNEKIDYNFYSKNIHQKTSVKLISNNFKSKKFLLCFHGLGSNEEDFINKTNLITDLADEDVTLIFINGYRSFYVNGKNGFNMYDCIDEIILKVSKLLNIDIKENLYLLGFSMGGYGAMNYFLKNNYIKGVFSISGSLDIRSRDQVKRQLDNYIKDEWISIFGSKLDVCNNLLLKTDLVNKRNMIVSCGFEDHLLKSNEIFCNKFEIDLIIEDGKHDYTFVSKVISKYIKEFING